MAMKNWLNHELNAPFTMAKCGFNKIATTKSYEEKQRNQLWNQKRHSERRIEDLTVLYVENFTYAK